MRGMPFLMAAFSPITFCFAFCSASSRAVFRASRGAFAFLPVALAGRSVGFLLFLKEIVIAAIEVSPLEANSQMAGNWFSRVRSWLITSTMAGVRRTKSYNRCRPVASRWFVGSSSRIATGECNSMPARKIRVFSPAIRPSDGRGEYHPFPRPTRQLGHVLQYSSHHSVW